MKARLSCMACFVKQGVNTLKLTTEDPALQRRAVDEILRRYQGISLDASPAYLSNIVYQVIQEMTGVADPFAAAKKETNRLAIEMAPDLRRKIERSADPLHTAVKIALSGNIIDMGIGHAFDLEKDVERIAEGDLTVDDYPVFCGLLKTCRRLLYLCDNAGEIVFDALLIERLKTMCEVTATVKSAPIINDATMLDAEMVGLTKLVPVIETGNNYIGVNWEQSTAQFKEKFLAADVIIAKGQGNFETLNERSEEIFFLLKAKCPEVADELGVREGNTVFVRSRGRSNAERR